MEIEFVFPEEPEIMDKDHGFYCTHCGSYNKRYHRSINSNMCITLLTLYKSGLRDYVHIEDLMRKSGHKRSGDFPYLVHWKFLEKKPGDREDGSNRNGFYKITGLGLMFVEKKLKAKQKALIFHNEFEGFEGEEIDIEQALGTKFNYSELMYEATFDSYLK